ncbi:hypothetical protein JCM10908_003197 [Rhodotorula pacifica]|uniref:uncharacterized protein n=1 Tax=Rhodotorula pacifica TaxID=1495444 RepID=UPI0031754C8F
MPAAPSPTAAFDEVASSHLTFYINGTRVQLDASTVDPEASLLSFIRSQPGLTGTKLGCGEGGCGACTVVIQSVHPRTGEMQHLAINACLAPLLSVEGKHVITVEGIGSSDNPHPLQERLWKLNGFQCGFCGPGIVMSIYALLRNAAYKGQLTVEDVELEGALDGNLCRCTGYAPIFMAVKSFCGDYLAPKSPSSNGSNGASTPALSSGSSSSSATSPPSTPNGSDDEYIVPFNYDAAGLDKADNQCKSACCGKPDGSAEMVSTDVSLPVPSKVDASTPPIDSIAGGTGRTAPINPADQAPEASSIVHQPNDAPTNCEPVKKGCGRADCCQLGGGDKAKKESTKPTHSFPQFDLKPYQPATELIFPPGLRKHELKPLKFGSELRNWYRPITLEQVVQLKKAIPDAKLVGGSSEVAIEVGIKGSHYPACIYISDVPELAQVSLPDTSSSSTSSDSKLPVLGFGANLTLSDLERVVRDLIATLPKEQTGVLRAIRDQLRYFAGRQIRNAASTGGNIATASPISDLNPVWVACGAKVKGISPTQGEFELGMDDFFIGYRKTRLPDDAVLVSVVVPLSGDVGASIVQDSKRVVVRAYKQARRRDDDIAIVTGCGWARVDSQTKTIETFRFAYGGMAAFTVLAKKAADFLVGKPVNSQTLNATLDVLGQEFDLPYSVPGGMPSYRRTLVMSFFFKFFVEMAKEAGVVLDGVGEKEAEEATEVIHRGISSSTRDNSDPYAQTVLGTQVPHVSGLKHATGEAIYLDDMPNFANEGYLSLVLSTKSHAKILSVDAADALEMEGVLTYVDWRDLPSEKANAWGTAAVDEFFFAKDEVTCHGQIIGAIVAKTKLQAQRAARKVKVEYEELPLILTIEEALQADSFHTMYDRRIACGKPTKEALAESENTLSGTLRLGGQEHFYLETMAALAVPKLESGEMECFSSTQDPSGTQRWVAQATGVPRNRIVAKSKRLGGGFGGKESRTAMIAVACAVAAKKLRRPVRCMLERHEDIKTSGQRHPFLVNWKVGFTNEGKLTALDADLYANGGYSLDISGGVVDRALAHAENAYYIPNVDVRGKICKTHTVSNTAYRGFGGPQGMLIAETYIEAIATHLNLDIDHVRAINLFKEGQLTPYHQAVVDWHVPRLLEDCKRDSQYEERKKAVEQYNKEHRWRKRGIALVPTKFGLAFGVKAMNQGAALVSILLDGSVLVAHGGTEMGQGLYTKCLQIAAEELRVPLEAVFTSETATNTVPNTVPTAASAGSDLNGYAILNACRELNKRLAPFREELGPDAPMSALAGAAWGARVSLSTTGHYATPNLGYVWNCQERTGDLFHYYTQGVAATEVELDLLTGDHTVLRTDIKMDVGRSINPAIDYGQIEGAFVQGYGWSTMEESLWLRNGAIFTTGPGAYKIPGFADTPQVFNVSLLRDAEWPNLGSVHSSKGIGEPPFFLGCSVALALRHALKSARLDAGIPLKEVQEFRFPLTSERLRMAVGDELAKRGEVKQKDGEAGFFVHI